MAELVEGRTGTRKDGTRVVVRGGKIVPLEVEGRKPRPDIAPNAFETVEGAVLIPTKKGVQVVQGGQMATGDAKTRINLALEPAVNAQDQMARSEGRGTEKPINPFNEDWGATLMMGEGDNGSAFDAIGKTWGGQDFQDYLQASKSFESGIIPIFSGAAVTPSEASRFIKANLPELGDSPKTLEAKARNRASIMNSAARLTGQPTPFPDVPTWQESRLGAASGGGAPRTTAPVERAPIQSKIPPEGLTDQQKRAAGRFKGTKADSGTERNPSIPVTQAQYDALPVGTWYIHRNGQVVPKRAK